MYVLQTTAHNCKARLNLRCLLPSWGAHILRFNTRGRFALPAGMPIGPARVGAPSPFFFLLFRNLNNFKC
jgi:hypothetical protein